MRNFVNQFSTLIFLLFFFVAGTTDAFGQKKSQKVNVGAYYYDGWSGINRKADDPNEPWAKNAPTSLTRRMVEEFSKREPVWGWRDDSPEIMERQIDLAADNGVGFFLFCWYWRDNKGPINPELIQNLPQHTSMNLFMKSKNKKRMRFALLVANHQGAEIEGVENWGKAVEYWMQYFNDPQYLKVDGKPLVVIFSSKGIDNEAMAQMQEAAKRQGLKGLSITGCGNTMDKNFTYRTHYNVIPGYNSSHEEHKYAELADAQRKEWFGTINQPYIPTVIAGWDKRPWEDKSGNGQGGAKQGWYYPDHTPEQFKSLLTDAIKWMDKHPEQTTEERLITVYAWNELGEGGYLVPTKGDPDASYLKVIREVTSEQLKKFK